MVLHSARSAETTLAMPEEQRVMSSSRKKGKEKEKDESNSFERVSAIAIIVRISYSLRARRQDRKIRASAIRSDYGK